MHLINYMDDNIIIKEFLFPLNQLFLCLFNLFEIYQKDLWLFSCYEDLFFELNLVSICDFADFCSEMYHHIVRSSTTISDALALEDLKAQFVHCLENQCSETVFHF